MELRKTEESLQEVAGLYESLRLSDVWTTELGKTASPLGALPEIVPTPPTHVESADEKEVQEISNKAATDTTAQEATANATTAIEQAAPPPPPTATIISPPPPLKISPIPDVATAVSTLQAIQTTLSQLPIARFRKRMTEKDPITQKPRYGEKTLARVYVLVETFDFLNAQVSITQSNDGGYTSTALASLEELQSRHTQQVQKEEEDRRKLETERQRRDEEAKLAALQQEQEARAAAQVQAERERQRQEEEAAALARQAEAARQRRLAREREEREWMDNIPKGVPGVKLQLEALRQDTLTDKAAYRTAITALHTLFQQINAHPEETKFRRIRRDHEKFQSDIGKHKGGVELLIAAGFILGAIDDIPCYLSIEPNIEQDMDGWSAWFDLLKGTLQVLEEELTRV